MIKDQFGNELNVGDRVNANGLVCLVKDVDYYTTPQEDQSIVESSIIVLETLGHGSEERRYGWKKHDVNVRGWIRLADSEGEYE